MQYDLDQLDALRAIVDEGTFDAAARSLVITQSAVSQRVRALENRVGRVLVIRSTPARATPDGEHLVRLARQMRLLTDETAVTLETSDTATTRLPVAVNADSLSTWFRTVLASAATWDATVLQVHSEDQERSARLLRDGSVMGAVTADPVTVQGCSSEPLGAMRYVPVATPDLLARHRSSRRVRWAELPVVRFNEHDDLQEQVLLARGLAGHRDVATHRVPSAEGFAFAVRAGLGWGALPEQHLGTALEDGELVRLPGSRPIDVHLYWQRWRLRSAALDRLSAAVREAAGELRRARRPS